MRSQVWLILAGLCSLGWVLPSEAEESGQVRETPSPEPPIVRLRDRAISLQQRQQPATTVKDWIAQIEAATVKVTRVSLDRTDAGLQITLETAEGKPLQIDATKFRTEGNKLIADISNAILTLPGGQEFRAENPTTDIVTLQITQRTIETIQVVVVGNGILPTTEVVLKTGSFAYVLNPEEEGTDQEIVVTGSRPAGYNVPNASVGTGTDTPVLETPFSVQVVPKEVLQDQQVIRLEDALTNISSISSAGNNGGREAAFSIRGFGNQFAGSVPTLRDGYRLYGNFQGISELANVDRVEVLKGPASILYGEIEPGGVINLTSKKPLAQPLYEAELQVGSRRLIRPRIDLTGPLTPDGRLLYRLNALYQTDRTFRNFITDTNRYAIAPALQWKVDDRTDLSLNLEYLNQTGPADFGISRFGNGVAPVSREFVINNPDDSITTNYLSTGYNLEYRFNEEWKLRNSFRYVSYDYNYSVVALPLVVQNSTILRFFADQDGQDRSYSFFTSVVGKFSTGSIRHTLTAGVDLNWSESSILTLFGNPAPLDIFNPNYDLFPKPNRADLVLFGNTLTTANRLGFYLQDQVYLLESLILVAGFRYDTISSKTSNVATAFTPGGMTQQTDDALTPRVGLLYRPVPELALFANYSQSFKPSTATTATGGILKPERGEGFEVGVKTELLNQKLLATLTYFDITKKNVGVADPNNPLFSIAVGEQNSRGVELDISGELLPGWKVITSYAYIDARVTNDTDTTLIGNQLFGIPHNKASLWTTYEIQQGDLQGLGFGIGLEYADSRFGDLANSFRVGSYFIGNAGIFYRRDNYRIALNIRNFSNASYIRALTGNDGGIEPGEPLTVIGSVGIQF
ncbi:TonB-dependent siderophore receptor [Leptolyngbya sp. 'hensonii']|uniref:TonB-dependent siderophore receptor n=1 Tax=Leptolyngbya sp. 'hensonii' TaxID=1922337 RepID=UPI000A5B5F23|nr:TonB-dependent siderophore receptor [Leptolyngbya sp. 'hensonii']